MRGSFGERTKRIHISIPESLEEDMRDFIATSHHRYEKGAISSLVTEALRLYLDPVRQNTHTQKANSHNQNQKYSNHKYDVFMSQIKAYLMPKYRYSLFNNIPEKHIDEAISALMDIRDSRSIKAWRQKLEMGGYIERTEFGAKVFKILKDLSVAV